MFTPKPSYCKECVEVIRICWADLDNNVKSCQQIPVSEVFTNGAVTMSLADVWGVLFALVFLMATAYSFNLLIRFFRFN